VSQRAPGWLSACRRRSETVLPSHPDCGDLRHEILLKLLFYTTVRVSEELVQIEIGDLDLDAGKISPIRAKEPSEYGAISS
jgi:hypothetical protein